MNDAKIGLLHSKTLFPSNDSNEMNVVVELDCNVFYLYDLSNVLTNIITSLKFTTTKLKRLHIALDTPVDYLSEFKRMYYNPSVGFKFRNRVQRTGLDDTVTYIGGFKATRLSIAIYNKTTELIKSHKEYIKDIHRKAFGYNTIYRIEARLGRIYLNTHSIDMLKLSDPLHLETIFSSCFNEMVMFTDSTTNQPLNFLPLNNKVKLTVIEKEKIPKFANKKIKEIINLIDNEMYTEECKAKQKEFKMVRDILIKKYNMQVWYQFKK